MLNKEAIRMRPVADEVQQSVSRTQSWQSASPAINIQCANVCRLNDSVHSCRCQLDSSGGKLLYLSATTLLNVAGLVVERPQLLSQLNVVYDIQGLE